MKPGPVVAMVALIFVGIWLVLQPTFERTERIDPEAQRFEMTLGSRQFAVEQRARADNSFEYHTKGLPSADELGQCAFFGRMMVQWVVSEKKRESVVPSAFWWMSLIGGVCLFSYFVWRVDFIGVLGQSTGVVIYARNIRLIHKQKRRLARSADDETR